MGHAATCSNKNVGCHLIIPVPPTQSANVRFGCPSQLKSDARCGPVRVPTGAACPERNMQHLIISTNAIAQFTTPPWILLKHHLPSEGSPALLPSQSCAYALKAFAAVSLTLRM